MTRGRISVAAMLRELGIGKNFVGRSANDEASLRAFRILLYLFNRGCRDYEMFLPPLRFRGSDFLIEPKPLNPLTRRPQPDVMRAWMQSLDGELPHNDPMLEFCSIFKFPKSGERVVSLAIGRSTLLSIETGVLTPEDMDRFIANSPRSEYDRLLRSMRGMEQGTVSCSYGKKQKVYVPPNIFVICVVDNVKVRLKGDLVLIYTHASGRIQKVDPDHDYVRRGVDFPALMKSEETEHL